MCGFVGWVDLHPEKPEILERMTAALAHRGPDASGTYIQGPLALGHRRLAILDLAASLQPMLYESYALAYNGELYNFRELRKELEALGHRFQTEGDTEVLLHALIEWKETVLPRLQGMFAFAFWDGKELLLARDHFGVKPLYICQTKTGLLFASEMKALLEHPAVSREVDREALGLYLECQYIPAPYSIFRQIRKLPSAHYFKNGESKCYWKPTYLPKFEIDEESAVDELEKELRRSVRSMLIADVPIGAFVSGGIDSSLVASLMQAESGKKTKIFSIALGEQEHAARVASYLGAEYYPFSVSAKDILGMLDQMFDEPFGDQAALPTLILSQLTRGHVKVVLTGEGADEVFAGYSNYVKKLREAPLAERYGKWAFKKIYPFLPMKLRKNRLLKAMGRPLSRRYTTVPNIFDREMHSSILQFQTQTALEDRAEFHYESCNSPEYLDRMLHIDQNLWLPDDLLTKVDRATMAYSLEARVPYLDHHLVEFAARLPASLKLGKRLLKRVALRGYLPEEIVHRPKQGFVLPLHEWMEGELKPLMEDVLNSLQQRRLFHPSVLKKKHHATRLFALLSLELWFRRYVPNYAIELG